MQKVTIIENIFSRKKEVHEVEDALEFLCERFPVWPANARIFHERIAFSQDVTPGCEDDIAKLRALEGDLFVLLMPGEAGTIALVISIVMAVVAVAAAFLFKPKVPTPASNRNQQSTSPNNELSARTNKARPGGRIPDVFGTVRSTPDLLVSPYSEYDAKSREIEHSVMCIGRGQYEIHDMYDGETDCHQIADTCVHVYRPHTDIVHGQPYFSVGGPINEPPRLSKRSNSVNGQKLLPANAKHYNGNSNVVFRAPNIVALSNPDDQSLSEIFRAGDDIEISGCPEFGPKYTDDFVIQGAYPVKHHVGGGWLYGISIPYTASMASLLPPMRVAVMDRAEFTYSAQGMPDGSANFSGRFSIYHVEQVGARLFIGIMQQPLGAWTLLDDANYAFDAPGEITIRFTDLNGLYTLNGNYWVQAVAGGCLYLKKPEDVNLGWRQLRDLNGQSSPAVSVRMETSGENWVGPFILEDEARTEVWCNFIALNGLYKDDGEKQRAVNVEIVVEVQALDRFNNPQGNAQEYNITLPGSASDKNTVARTMKIGTFGKGRCRVRARRVTPTDTGFKGSVVDEVQWRDMYSMGPLPSTNFGDVTIVRTSSVATTGALALKERKLNCLVTRQLPRRISGSRFTRELYSTNNVADIFSAICLDPHIGNRSKEEIDFDNVYDTLAEVEAYFGTHLMTEFCYTMDSENLSFEETAAMVASAAFCTPYRMGSVIRLSFERSTKLSTLLFNHRNKLPGSETRTATFGHADGNDGVIFEYVSPDDDAIVTMHLPEDQSAVNPAKIESVGIRNVVQAHIHAWRTWQKMRYQSLSIEFDATQEADMLIKGERILVTDNIGSLSIEGEVWEQDGMEVFTSQNLPLVADDVNVWGEPIRKQYICFLQLCDGTVQTVPVFKGNERNSFILNEPPLLPLVYGEDRSLKTLFTITESRDDAPMAFLVGEKRPKGNFTSSITAINYDERYYAHDRDYINGVIRP